MIKKRIMTAAIVGFAAVALIVSTLSFTSGYMTDRKEQAVTMNAATLDYSIMARIDGDATFDKYDAVDGDIRLLEFILTNNSESDVHAEIGLSPSFMFDKSSDVSDLLFYPESVSDADIHDEIQSGTFTKNYGSNEDMSYDIGFGKQITNTGQTTSFKVKVVNKSDINKANVSDLHILASLYTGNASGGYGFIEKLEDTNNVHLYYFMNNEQANNEMMQGVQTVTRTIPWLHIPYTQDAPLVTVLNDNIIEHNRIEFFDADGRLGDYGLSLEGATGKITGTPDNMPSEYTIYFRYADTSAWYNAWLPASARTDGTYVGKAVLKFTREFRNTSDVTIADIPPYTYDGTEKKPEPVIKYGDEVLVKGVDYDLEYSDNINAGTATMTVVGKDNLVGNFDKTFTIEKAGSVVGTVPTMPTLVYNHESQTLLNSGTTSDGIMMYRIKSYDSNILNAPTEVYDNEFTETIPKAFDAGMYIIEYYVKGDANHNDSTVSSVVSLIAKADYVSNVVIDDYVYDGTLSIPSVTNNPEHAAVTYYGRSEVSGAGTNWLEVTSKTFNAGTRYIYAVIEPTNNYNGCITGNTSFNIAKADFVSIVTIEPYTYLGTVSVPDVTVNPENGQVHYYGRASASGAPTDWDSVTNITYDAGERYIYAIIDETTNYNSCRTDNTSFNIAKADFTSAVRIADYTYDDVVSEPEITNNPGNGMVKFFGKGDPLAVAVAWNNVTSKTFGSGKRYVYAHIGETTNYNEYTTPLVEFTINKGTYSSTVSISDYTYDGTKPTPTVSYNPEDGGVTYYVKSSTGGLDWNGLTNTSLNAGTHTMYAVIAETANYESVTTGDTDFTINKATYDSSVVVANGGYVYDGEKSVLSVNNNPENGAVVYYARETADGPATEWSEVDSKTYDAGTRYVYAVIAETTNYLSKTTGNTEYEIAKAEYTPVVTMSGYVYDAAEKPVPSTAPNPENGAVTYYSKADLNEGTVVDEWKDVNTKTYNAGDHYIYAVVAETTNYKSMTSEPLMFTVERANYTPVVTIASYTYAGEKATPSVAPNPEGAVPVYYTKDKADDDDSLAKEWSTVTSSDYKAGTHVIYAMLPQTTNYNAQRTANADLTILKASYTPTVSLTTYVYGEEKGTPSVANNIENGPVTYYVKDTETSEVKEWSTVSSTEFDAGTHYVYAVIGETDNYEPQTTATVEFTINKADFTSEVTIDGYTYLGTVSEPNVTNNPGNAIVIYYGRAEDNADAGTLWDDVTNITYGAGTHYCYAYIPETTNYNAYTTTNKAFLVSRADVTDDEIVVSDYTYDGTVSTPSLSDNPGMSKEITYYVKASRDDNDDTDDIAWTTLTPTYLNAGTYYVYATVGQTDNYNAYKTGLTEFKVNKADLIVTVNMTGYTYAGTKSQPITTGNVGGGTETFYGRATENGTATKWDDVTSITYDAGTRYVYVVIEESENYNAYDGSENGNTSFIISKADREDTVVIDGYTYLGTVSTPDVTDKFENPSITFYGRENDDDSVGVEWKDMTNTTFNAGTRYCYAVIGETTNYNSYTTPNKAFVIAKADYDSEVTIAGYTYLADPSKPDVTYNPEGGTVTFYGLADDEEGTVPVLWTSVIGTTYNAGEHYVYAIIGETANYNEKRTANKKFNINKATYDSVVVVENGGYVYDGTKSNVSVSYNPENGVVTYYSQATNASNVETKNYETEVDVKTYDAGTRYIYAVIAETANYEAKTTPLTSFEIAKADYIPVVTIADYVYLGNKSTPTVAPNPENGAVTYYSKDNLDEGTAVDEWKDVDGTTYLVGEHYIYAVVEETTNYNSQTSAIVSFNVTKADYDVTVSIPDYVYDGTKPTPSVNNNPENGIVTYYILEDENTSESDAKEWSTVNTKTFNAGDHWIYAVIDTTANYKAQKTEPVKFNIEKAEYTSAVTIDNYTYEGTVSTPSVTNNPEGGEVTYYGCATATGEAKNWNTVDNKTYDAGQRFIYATIAETINYKAYTTPNTEFTIYKADIDSSEVNIDGYTYLGTVSTPTVTYNPGNATVVYYGRINDDASDGTPWNTVTNITYNAGTHYCYAYIPETTNYNAYTTANKAFLVSRADVTDDKVIISDYTYAGEKSAPSLDKNPGNSMDITYYIKTASDDTNDDDDVEWSTITSSTLNADTYYIYAKVGETTNYNAYKTGLTDFKVNKANFSVTIDIDNYTYAGTVSTPTLIGNVSDGTVTFYGRATPSSTGIEWSTVNNKTFDAGERYIYVVIGEGTNYNAYDGSEIGNTMFHINKANRTGNVEIENYTYLGTVPTPSLTTEEQSLATVTFFGRASTDGVSTEWDDVTNITYDAGTRYCYATVSETTNYNAYTTPNTEFEIYRARFTATASTSDYVYAGTVSKPSVSANPGDGDVVYYGKSSLDDNNPIEWSRVTNTTFNAGTRYIYAVIPQTTNYEAYTTEASPFNIAKADFICVVNIDDYVYDGKVSTPLLSNNPGGGIPHYYGRATSNGADVEWDDVSGRTFNAGTRYIYAEIPETINYNAYTTGETSFVISKAVYTATVSVDDYTYATTSVPTPVITGLPDDAVDEATSQLIYYGESETGSSATVEWDDVDGYTFDAGTRYIFASIPELTNYQVCITEETPFEIFKADQLPPTNITATPTAFTTINVTASGGGDHDIIEYSIDTENWQDSSDFTDITEHEEYTLYARWKGNDNYNPSTSINTTAMASRYTWNGNVITGFSTLGQNCTAVDNIPARCTAIGNNAFKGNTNITRASLADTNITLIGRSAFSACTNLSGQLAFPETLTVIDYDAFYNCYNLGGSLVIPDSVITIGDYAFQKCSGLSGTLTLGRNLKSIGNYAFNGDSGLTGELVLPTGLETIGNYAFGGRAILSTDAPGCSGFTGDLIIPNTVTSIGASAFAECSGFNGNIVIPDSVTSIGGSAFLNCRNLKGDLVLPANLTVINGQTFSGCSKLTGNLVIPEGVTTIQGAAFQDCSGFDGTLTLPSSLRRIENNAFKGCTALSGDLVIPEGVTFVGEYAFYQDGSFRGELKLPSTLTSFGYYAFWNCTGLTGELVIPENVKTLPIGVFENCRNLSGEVIIPEGVTQIASGAFLGCNNITNVVIPNTVKKIGTYAFKNCYALDTIYIPESVTSIGSNVFQYSYNLKTVYIDQYKDETKLTNTDKWGMQAVTTVIWKTTDEDMFIWDGTTITGLSEAGKDLTKIVIPYNCTGIGADAFKDNTNITSLTLGLGGNLSTIAKGAFDGCNNISNTVTLPDGLTFIGETAFRNCGGLPAILDIPDGVTGIGSESFVGHTSVKRVNVPSSVTAIGSNAFNNCSGITDIYIDKLLGSIDGYEDKWGAPSGATLHWKEETAADMFTWDDTVITGLSEEGANLTDIVIPSNCTAIGPNAFEGNTKLRTVEIAEGASVIGDEAFKGCTQLVTIKIPASVQTIGSDALTGVTNNLRAIYVNQYESSSPLAATARWGAEHGTVYWKTSDETMFIWDGSTIIGLSAEGETQTSLVIPDKCTAIGPDVFKNNTVLKSIKIGNNVRTIGSSAFEGCTKLYDLTLTSNLYSIGDSAFKNCTALGTDGEGHTVYNYELDIPNKVTSIGANTFEGCANITTINIPSATTSIGANAFLNANTDRLYIDQYKDETKLTGSPWGIDEEDADEVIIWKTTNRDYFTWSDEDDTVITGLTEAGMSLTKIVTPDGTTGIANDAFNGNTNIVSVVIRDGVTSIGEGVFSGCTKLTSVSITDDVTSIGRKAFSSCRNLRTVNIPVNVTTIEPSTFESCMALSSITIPAGVTSIGNNAFQSCTNLSGMVIPEGVVSIGNYAFSSCSHMTSMMLPSTLTTIGSNAFARDSVLTSIVIPDSVTSIGSYMLQGCTALEDVTLSSQITTLSSSLFSGCSSLTDIDIPDNVTRIEYSVFYGCSSLTEVYISENVTYIGNNAFMTTPKLERIVINQFKDETSITGEPWNAAKTTDVVWKKTSTDVFTWSGSTITGLTDEGKLLTKITIPDEATAIAANAFEDNDTVETVFIGRNITFIGAEAFKGCSALKTVNVTDSVTSIGNDAFSECTSLEAVNIDQYEHETVITGQPWGTDEDKIIWKATPDDTFTWDEDIPTMITGLSGTSGSRYSDLEELIIPAKCTAIGDDAFSGMPRLKKLVIGKNVKTIGAGAFSGCTALEGDLIIPEGVISIGDEAFYGCGKEGSTVIFPSTLTTIGDSAFGEVEYNGSLNLPANLEFVGDGAFYASFFTGQLMLPDSLTYIGDGAFMYTDFEGKVTIPDKVTYIGSEAFDTCAYITEFDIPASVTWLGTNAFSGCDAVEAVNIDKIRDSISGSPWGLTDESVIHWRAETDEDLFTWDETVTTMITGLTDEGKLLSEIAIPAKCTAIGDSAFKDNATFTKIEILNTVTSIGNEAFSGCTGLTSIEIPWSVNSIGTDAFAGCTNLEYIDIDQYKTDTDLTGEPWGAPEDTEVIWAVTEDYMFIWDGSTIIGLTTEGASLGTIVIPDKCTAIGDTAFRARRWVTSVTIPGTVETIGKNAFMSCKNLNEVIMQSGVKSIGERAFYASSNLLKVTLADTIETIGPNAFQNCTALEEIDIPASIVTMDTTSFKGATNLKTININLNKADVPEGAPWGAPDDCLINCRDGVLLEEQKPLEIPEMDGTDSLTIDSADNGGAFNLIDDFSIFRNSSKNNSSNGSKVNSSSKSSKHVSGGSSDSKIELPDSITIDIPLKTDDKSGGSSESKPISEVKPVSEASEKSDSVSSQESSSSDSSSSKSGSSGESSSSLSESSSSKSESKSESRALIGEEHVQTINLN